MFQNDKLGLMNHLLQEVVDVLNGNGIDYYLDCGTLLGCIRDKKLIINDTDVDVTIHLSQWHKLNSINFEEHNLIKTRTRELFPNFMEGNLISVKTEWSELYCDIYANPAFPHLIEKDMRGFTYNVPIESELYLKQLYGDDWKIPSGKHADTVFHRNNGLIESEYSEYWNLEYEIFKCIM
tara:strand:- start:117 stop:656 length:540 start_codon:yes stop_codon:yes gene_type:complete